MSDAMADRTVVVGPRTVTINWSAIIAGWLVATGIAWIFYVLGLALGFSTVDVSNANPSGPPSGWGIGTRVWLFATWAVSLFLGGMFASWFDGKTDQTVGALHAIAVWALASTVTALLVGLGSVGVLQGGASLVRGLAPAAAAGGVGAAMGNTIGRGRDSNDPAMGTLQATVKQGVSQAMLRSSSRPAAPAGPTAPASAESSSASTTPSSPGTTQSPSTASASPAESRRSSEPIDPQMTAAVAADLVRGNVDRAKARMTAETSLSSAEVDQIVQGMSAQTERAKAELKEAAERTARYVAAAMWAVFFSSAIGLIAAALGGWLGAGHIHHVYDTELARWPARQDRPIA